MITLLNIIHILVCFFLVLVILLQAGKSGGMGGIGAGGSSTVFGSRGSQTLMGKVTAISATIFMLTSISLAWFSTRSESMVLNQKAEMREVEAPAQDTITAPATEQPAADEPAEENDAE